MSLLQRLKPRYLIALGVLGVAAASGGPPVLAHPGHTNSSVIELPTWQLRDGGSVNGLFLKLADGLVSLTDAEGRVTAVSLDALDDTGRAAVERAANRVRLINHEPTADRTPPAGLFAHAFTGLLVADSATPPPEAAKAFAPFERLKLRWDERYLYVESNGLPDHPMMAGIRAWQQQVPLPQPYTGDNAWRIPLHPVDAAAPAMIKGRFLRGAVALAANGIPIFNPQNNRGEISQEIGELDEWGGHCGRGDDYHYHVVPLKLQATVGQGKPLAYALDGYPIYGLTEPDGSPVAPLDACAGHATPAGYHYHASTKYPYVLAGFHGEVTEREGQVDPQPRDTPIRPAGAPLRGATINSLRSIGNDRLELTYEIDGRSGFVRYGPNPDGSYTFDYQDVRGQTRSETHQRRNSRAAGRDGVERNGVEPAAKAPAPVRAVIDRPAIAPPARDAAAPAETSFKLTSPVVIDGGALPVEFTGDGTSATPPLAWSGAPAGTKSFAVIMHHIPGPGDVKWYWILYNIPADVTALPKNVSQVGVLGTNTVNRRQAYAPPHSKGPGLKTYILTVYALSAEPVPAVPASQVDRPALLAAMKDHILASAELRVTYDRTSVIAGSAPAAANPADQPRIDPAPTHPPDGQPAAGNPPPPGSGSAVHLLRREVEEAVQFTPDQKAHLAALETEANERLARILTPEQLTALRSMRPPPRDAKPRPAE